MKMVIFGISQEDSGCEQTVKESSSTMSLVNGSVSSRKQNLVLITGVAPAQWHRKIPTYFQQPKTQIT